MFYNQKCKDIYQTALGGLWPTTSQKDEACTPEVITLQAVYAVNRKVPKGPLGALPRCMAILIFRLNNKEKNGKSLSTSYTRNAVI